MIPLSHITRGKLITRKKDIKNALMGILDIKSEVELIYKQLPFNEWIKYFNCLCVGDIRKSINEILLSNNITYNGKRIGDAEDKLKELEKEYLKYKSKIFPFELNEYQNYFDSLNGKLIGLVDEIIKYISQYFEIIEKHTKEIDTFIMPTALSEVLPLFYGVVKRNGDKKTHENLKITRELLAANGFTDIVLNTGHYKLSLSKTIGSLKYTINIDNEISSYLTSKHFNDDKFFQIIYKLLNPKGLRFLLNIFVLIHKSNQKQDIELYLSDIEKIKGFENKRKDLIITLLIFNYMVICFPEYEKISIPQTRSLKPEKKSYDHKEFSFYRLTNFKDIHQARKQKVHIKVNEILKERITYNKSEIPDYFIILPQKIADENINTKSIEIVLAIEFLSSLVFSYNNIFKLHYLLSIIGISDYNDTKFNANYYRLFERIIKALDYLQNNYYIDDWVFYKVNNKNGYFENYFKKPNRISIKELTHIYLIVKAPGWLEKYYDKSKIYSDPNSSIRFIIPEQEDCRLSVGEIKTIRSKLFMTQPQFCEEINKLGKGVNRSVKWLSNMENVKRDKLLDEKISEIILKIYERHIGKKYK